MKRTVTLLLALGLVFALSGCSFVDKVKAKFKGNKTEKTETATATKTTTAKKSTGTKKTSTTKRKRIFCSSKKTYKKGTACWHWKRGARKAKAK